ncbi:MAG: pirin family protein [Flavobacteriales bacterium]|jgi:redox-sensitive bicupin YhaK (pirin superfamily)|nr:pirin family protein [Flavobacteriales bacterium]
MSNISVIIEERARNIGNFLVGRLLPFREKRMVGPFIYLDHMRPLEMDERTNFDVPPHPHIGLSTLTYLFEGTIMHRDSLGTAMEINPGAVNWMTAGGGIVHSERTPERLRKTSKRLHGLQIWVALPKELEQMEPSFFHAAEGELPVWEEDGVRYKLVAGEVMGHRSPVPVQSRCYMVKLVSPQERVLDIGHALYGEVGLYILEGAITNDGDRFGPGQILVAKNPSICRFTMEAGTTVFLFGGEAMPEPRHIDWNFVATSRELIDAARQRWIDQKFVPVPGETEFVPLPGAPPKKTA